MALGFIVGMFGREIFKINVVTVTALLFLTSILKGVITLFLCYVFHNASVSQVLHIILPESFYNALVAPFLFMLLDRIFAKELQGEGVL